MFQGWKGETGRKNDFEKVDWNWIVVAFKNWIFAKFNRGIVLKPNVIHCPAIGASNGVTNDAGKCFGEERNVIVFWSGHLDRVKNDKSFFLSILPARAWNGMHSNELKKFNHWEHVPGVKGWNRKKNDFEKVDWNWIVVAFKIEFLRNSTVESC